MYVMYYSFCIIVILSKVFTVPLDIIKIAKA